MLSVHVIFTHYDYYGYIVSDHNLALFK